MKRSLAVLPSSPVAGAASGGRWRSDLAGREAVEAAAEQAGWP
jgi:hypothetical protein